MDNELLGLDKPFQFECNRCSKCCDSSQQVFLSPYDIFRIAKHFDKTPTHIIDEYCNYHFREDLNFPFVHPRPRGIKNTCSFLVDKQCTIHHFKPSVCALFPIRRIPLNKDILEYGEEVQFRSGYILVPIKCRSTGETTATVRQLLEKFDIPIDDISYHMWYTLIKHVPPVLNRLEETTTLPAELLALKNSLVNLLYFEYDIRKEFLPQFLANNQKIERLIF